MAEPAQKEPTMEEILSSIRKIIADDDAPAEEAAEAAPAAEEEFDVFETSEEPSAAPADDLMATEPVESEEDVLAAISASMDEFGEELDAEPTEFEAAPEPEMASDEMDFATDEDEFSAFAENDFDGVEDFAEAEDSFELVEDEPVMEDLAPLPEPEPVIEEEAPMSAKPAPLTDSATVTAAAGSLGKLLSSVEFGQDGEANNTLEGLVREMLRPMLKDWLDENLPAIVEKQVEAEVKRIARMAG